MITRSGSNELHGSAFYFFRDHKLSAYPVLNRDPGNPDPFFQRRQLGAALGGPLLRNRIFYFANLERNEQRGVVSTTLAGDFASLSRITPSPVFGTQASVRLDANLTPAHIAFARYSHDGGSTLTTAINNQNAYPSSWDRTKIWNDQSVVGLTSVLRPVLVNDLRLSYFFTSTSQSAPGQEDCPGCLGIGAPAISIPTGPTMGYSGKFQTMGRRIELNDSMSWQKGSHRVRIGTDWEYNRSGSLNYGNNPVTMVLFSPDQVRTYNARPQTPPGQQIPLPATFNTLADILKLPLQSITVGIGDPRLPQSDGGLARHWNNVRLYVQDSWKVRQSLTLNYGLAWNIDRFQNYDLAKPALLAPILGADGLGPTQKQWRNFSPALGLAWSPGIDDKTVIRAGAGIYYDFNFQVDLDSERALFSKPGLGHTDLSGTAIPNPLPGITGVPVGRALDFRGTPTFFTGSNLIAAIPAIRAAQEEKLRYTGDPSVRLIQITKQAATAIYPANLPTGTSQHSNIGFQREVVRNFVVSTDFVYRHFIHLGLANPDLNHYNSVRGPVIPKCSALQADDPTALCSNGRIKVSANSGVSAYKGLLFRADKRFSHGFQVLGSYAYSSNTGTSSGNGFNLDNWLQNRGPIAFDVTHIANLSAVSQLPWRLQLGLNLSYSSAPPGSAFIGGIDLNGDGTTGDLLPGTTVNSLNRGLERGELARLVDEFNQNYGGKNDAQGTAIKRLALPGRYAFGDNSHSLDLRLTRSFVLREHWRLAVIGEVFNLYNKANLSGFSGDLTSPAFGQPTSRATQIYGSAGPRAFQVAARMTF